MVAIENVGSSELSYIYKIGLNTDSSWNWSVGGRVLGHCTVIPVISCLAFVTFTLAVVIIMCSLQESVWAVTSMPLCIFHLQFHLGQDYVWEQAE